jgi:hypothetical protein
VRRGALPPLPSVSYHIAFPPRPDSRLDRSQDRPIDLRQGSGQAVGVVRNGDGTERAEGRGERIGDQFQGRRGGRAEEHHGRGEAEVGDDADGGRECLGETVFGNGLQRFGLYGERLRGALRFELALRDGIQQRQVLVKGLNVVDNVQIYCRNNARHQRASLEAEEDLHVEEGRTIHLQHTLGGQAPVHSATVMPTVVPCQTGDPRTSVKTLSAISDGRRQERLVGVPQADHRVGQDPKHGPPSKFLQKRRNIP